MMLRARDGKTRVEPHSGQFMKRHLSGDRRQTTIPAVRTPRAGNPAPEESAKEAGLRYTNDGRPGIRRIRRGSSFRYLAPDGKIIRNGAELRRIKSLVIPPAW
jgi:hypothetical protein